MKTGEQLIENLRFTDDVVMIAWTEWTLQHIIYCFKEVTQLFQLEVSLKKPEVFHQPTTLEEYHPTYITIGVIELKAFYRFINFGFSITSDVKIEKEINYRLAKGR